MVQISSGAGFPTPAPFPQECTTVHTTLVYGDEPGNCWPTAPGTYSWRVTARDEFSNEMPVTDGIAAPVGTFTYKPQLVTTTGPPSGSIYADPYDPNQSLGAPVLTWNPVAGADKYKVTIQGTTTQSFTTAALSYAPRYLAPGTYSWDVQTVDALGAIGAGHATGQRTFTVKQPPMVEDLPDHPGQFVLMPVPDPLPAASPPHPTNPALGSSYRFPSLTWSPVTWVDHYEVCVARAGNTFTRVSGDFEWAAGDDTGTTRLNPGNYEWYVKAVRKDGTTLTGSTGTFSIMSLPDIPVESYKAALTGNALTGNAGTAVDTCNLKLPSNCQNLRATPVLGWDSPNDNVGHYVEVLSKDAEITNPIETKTIVNTMYLDRDALPDSQAGSAYFDGHPPVRRGRRVFLADTLHALVQQADPTVDPDLPPRRRPGAERRHPHLGRLPRQPDRRRRTRTPSLPRPARTRRRTTTCRQRPTRTSSRTSPRPRSTRRRSPRSPTPTPRAPPGGGSRRSTGTATPWRGARARSFLKKSPVPQLQLPADGATVPGDYTLSWAAQPYAASYDIEVYKGGDTSGNTVNLVINDSTDRVQYVLTNLDPSSGPYAWRVRRHDGKNRPGDWSPYRTFNVIRPGVTLISPVDNDTTVSPADQLFTWVPVQGATSYKFERRPGTSGNATETVDTPSTKWAPIAAIAGGSWQWRVTAYDTANNLIADSSWLHPFSVTDTPIASVPVSITGSGVVDSTLTLNPPQWNMPNNLLTITYQWFRGTSPVAGADRCDLRGHVGRPRQGDHREGDCHQAGLHHRYVDQQRRSLAPRRAHRWRRSRSSSTAPASTARRCSCPRPRGTSAAWRPPTSGSAAPPRSRARPARRTSWSPPTWPRTSP